MELLLSNCSISLILCSMLAVTFVGSLYVWSTKCHRDHPSTIKKRFISVCVTTVISPCFVWFGVDTSYFAQDAQLVQLLGIRAKGLLYAAVIPLLLTMVLFLGPLTIHYMDGAFTMYLRANYWKLSFKNLMWLRNHLVAPFSEEFTFRACMLPLLVPCVGVGPSIYICPLFFGIAHLHHLRERLERNNNYKAALLQSLFQFSYTTVFGAYSAYLFLRTGHFVAPFVVHAFCNHMGFPEFGEVLRFHQPYKAVLILVFLLGFSSWLLLLSPLTQPFLYSNNLYWN